MKVKYQNVQKFEVPKKSEKTFTLNCLPYKMLSIPGDIQSLEVRPKVRR
jgi:hypothetical protein